MRAGSRPFFSGDGISCVSAKFICVCFRSDGKMDIVFRSSIRFKCVFRVRKFLDSLNRSVVNDLKI